MKYRLKIKFIYEDRIEANSMKEANDLGEEIATDLSTDGEMEITDIEVIKLKETK